MSQELAAELARCNRCGFCQATCPIFRATGHEAGVARGRLAILQALEEGELAWSPALEEPLFTCLLCGACTTNCFPAIPTADLLVAARSEYLASVRRSRVHRLLFERLLPYPARLRRAARLVALGQRSGLATVARALGLLRIFGRDFPRASEIVERFPARFLRERVEPGALPGEGQGPRIAYFVGCGIEVMTPQAGEASLAVLRRLAREVVVLENCCCGLPAWSYGDLEAARRLASRNLELIAEGFDLVVTDCSSCAAFLKKYPRLFPGDDPLRERAEAMAGKVRDWVEAVAEAELPLPEAGSFTVTYHDPCHASRGQGLVVEPRRLISSLPGADYRELPEADWCCGGAGSYSRSHYDLARKVLERKMRNVARTGARVVATSCPACMVHLAYGARLLGEDVRVCHLSELVAGGREPCQ